MKRTHDTIVAAATPPGRGGVAIVRVSGPLVFDITQKILHRLPKPRYAFFSPFYDESNQAIDEGLALLFPHPNSFTGEDVLELHCHGGPIVVDQLLKRVVALGARLAKSGEFSEQAFLNDKLDLAQAEAIADLIDATSHQAARSAMRSLQGEFSKKIHAVVTAVIHLRMYVEAAIDFVEEEINFLADQQVENQLASIMQTVAEIQASAVQGSLLRDGITVVIAGQPNVGKSSLLNQLSGKDIAIVTDIPGTTRDVLREYISIDGMPMHIIDTAGLRESDDPVEQEGIRRARDQIAQADLVLQVVDNSQKNFSEKHLAVVPRHIKKITVINKIDLTGEAPSIQQNTDLIVSLSAKTGEGMALLKKLIMDSVGFEATTEGTFSARRRHLDALSRAQTFLQNAHHELHVNKAGELLAEELRQAQLALSEITGEFTSDDLLGKIFSSFCIGK